MKLVTSFMNVNNLSNGYVATPDDFVESDGNKADFMDELHNNPLPINFFYTHLVQQLNDLDNNGDKYIVHRLLPSESDRLDKLSPLNEKDYRDYDGNSPRSGVISYAINPPIFITKLEEKKKALQNASRQDFIQNIQSIVNDIINQGGGYLVKRGGSNMRKWQRVLVNPTYDVDQTLDDDKKISDKANPTIPNLHFYFQGLVYFLTFHVPAEVVEYLSDFQLMEIYLFGVKVGESSQDLWQWWPYLCNILGFHPRLVAKWVCIGVPLGMNSWIIEQYIHFMHPHLHLNGEWWEHSILDYVPKILELFDTHIISLGRYTINGLIMKSISNNERTISGKIYATSPHVEETLRTALNELMVNNKDNCTLREFIIIFLEGTKFGYTALSNHKIRSYKYQYASAWFCGFNVVISDQLDNVYNVEQTLHQKCKDMQLNILGEMHFMVDGIVEAQIRINRETNVNSQIEFAKRLLHCNYSVLFIKLILHLGLTSKTNIENFLEDKCYIVTSNN